MSVMQFRADNGSGLWVREVGPAAHDWSRCEWIVEHVGCQGPEGRWSLRAQPKPSRIECWIPAHGWVELCRCGALERRELVRRELRDALSLLLSRPIDCLDDVDDESLEAERSDRALACLSCAHARLAVTDDEGPDGDCVAYGEAECARGHWRRQSWHPFGLFELRKTAKAQTSCTDWQRAKEMADDA